MKIVSLLPSATEIVCALGLREQLVGVTHECDFPDGVKQLPKVTRTLIPTDASSAEIDRLVREQLKAKNALYSLDMATLERLQPDVIVTQALCDVCAVAESEVQAAVCKLPGKPKVVNLVPMTLLQVFDAIRQVAAATNVTQRGEQVVGELMARVETVKNCSAKLQNLPRVAFLEWLVPPFSAGHWNPELINLAGGIDCLGQAGKPSRTLTWDEVAASKPDVVVIACCGFSIERTMQDIEQLNKVAQWQKIPAVRSKRVYIFDGSQYFNRPGPRLVDSLEMLAKALQV